MLEDYDCQTCEDTGYAPDDAPCPDGCFICDACGVVQDDLSFEPLCPDCGNEAEEMGER